MRVLVCDDEPQSVRALTVVLRGAGFDVELTRGAEAALDRAAVRPPDAAIVELRLPDGDGADVCRRLRDWSSMALIVVSAVDDERQKVRALEAGADDYVTKPFAERELVPGAGGAAARATRRGRRPTRQRPRPRRRPGGARRAPRRRGGPPHADRVRAAAPAARRAWAGAHPPHPVTRRLGPGVRARHRGPAHPHAHLRRKIERGDGDPLIRTEHRVGYRFAEPTPPPDPIRHLRAA